MTEYEKGFHDCKNSIESFIDDWYHHNKEIVDAFSPVIAISFLKLAIRGADIEEDE
jgi:hypothetical protein